MKYRYAKSKAGHDKDKIYQIVSEDDKYVYLVNENHPEDKPKRKNRKHIQLIK